MSKIVSKKKIDKLSRLYNLSKARDLFTVTMQEMEIVEHQEMCGNFHGDKKKAVIDIIAKVAETQRSQTVDIGEAAAAYIDDMCRASNMDFVINRSNRD